VLRPVKKNVYAVELIGGHLILVCMSCEDPCCASRMQAVALNHQAMDVVWIAGTIAERFNPEHIENIIVDMLQRGQCMV
jgi:hypothetical protein